MQYMAMQPEDIRRLDEDMKEHIAHEGDSVIFCRIMILIHSIRGTVDDDLYPSREKAIQDKIDSAYIAYAITTQQWIMCYEILFAPPEPTKDNNLPDS